MINELGKELRHLRIHHGERLFDMADRLRFSTAFLSALEHGKKAAPAGFEEKVIQAYALAPEAADNLCRAADLSRKAFTIEANTPSARETAGLLARKMPTLSEEELGRLRDFLNRKGA